MKSPRHKRLLIGLVFILALAAVVLTEAAARVRSVPARGRITKVDVPVQPDDRHSIPQDRLRVHYRFRDSAGVERSGSEEIERTGSDPSLQPGREILVSYRPDDPERNQMDAGAGNAIGMIVALLAGAIIVGLALFIGRSERFLALLAQVGRRSFRERLTAGQREPLLTGPFPAARERILRDNLGLYSYLTPAEQKQLQNVVQVLTAEKEWTGCNGLEMTDEVRVTIAGAAGVLILGREHDYYGTVQSILVYPTTFEMPAEQAGESGLVLRGRQSLLGQAWYRGPVLLAWDEVLADCRSPFEGRNVVYHEFAHQLAFEGAPLSAGKEGEEQMRRFAAVMQMEYEALVKASSHGRATLIDSYGASNPDEFFAVATECFFGQPEPLRRLHPPLYRVLREYYNQDPAARFSRAHPTHPPRRHE